MNNVLPGRCYQHPLAWIHLDWRRTMDTIPQRPDKAHKPVLTCENCGKEHTPERLRSKSHYCGMTCYKEATKNGDTKQCVICGNSFYVKRSLAEITFCCSASCARRWGATTRTGKQYTDGFINCLHCGTPVKVVLPQPKGHERKFCSYQCDKTYKIGENNPTYKGNFVDCTCLFCGSAFTKPESWVKKGEGKFCSGSCRSSYTIEQHGGMVSSIEIKVCNALDLIGEFYKHQHRIGKFLVDFYLPQRNLVIEADGDYWHSLERSKRQDANKDAYMADTNINITRLSETAINMDCQQLIEETLQRFPLIGE